MKKLVMLLVLGIFLFIPLFSYDVIQETNLEKMVLPEIAYNLESDFIFGGACLIFDTDNKQLFESACYLNHRRENFSSNIETNESCVINEIFERQIKRCRETRIFVDNIGFRV